MKFLNILQCFSVAKDTRYLYRKGVLVFFTNSVKYVVLDTYYGVIHFGSNIIVKFSSQIMYLTRLK